jgi:hypothetical protein
MKVTAHAVNGRPAFKFLQAAERDISDFAYFSDLGRGRGIIAAWTQKTSNCCDERIIAP